MVEETLDTTASLEVTTPITDGAAASGIAAAPVTKPAAPVVVPKADFDALRAERDALVAERDALREGSRGWEKVQTQLEDVITEIAAGKKAYRLLAASMEKGEFEGLGKQVEEAETQTAAQRRGERAWQAKVSRLNQAFSDEDGRPYLIAGSEQAKQNPEGFVIPHPQTSAEFKSVRDLVDRASREGDADLLDEARDAVLRILARLERAHGKAALAQARKEKAEVAERTKRETMKELGAAEADTGPAAGGAGNVSNDNLDAAYMKWEREHPDRQNPYADRYRELIGS